MRIRKNAKVSPLVYLSHVAAPEDFQPHVCSFNQNPWEVCPLKQLDGEDSSFFNGFASVRFNSIGADEESVASMMDTDEEEEEEEEEDNAVETADDPAQNGAKSDNSTEMGGGGEDLCQRNDGRGWHCKKKALRGQHYCNHHLSRIRANRDRYLHNNNGSSKEVSKESTPATDAVAQGRPRRNRVKAKKGSATDPFELYFYTGFGPKWSEDVRNRDKQEADEQVDTTIGATVTTSTSSRSRHTSPKSSSSSRIRRNAEKLDYLDDEDEDEDDYDDVGSDRKRKRRPIKARSLKDL